MSWALDFVEFTDPAASYSWTPPPGMNFGWVTGIGGGGAGALAGSSQVNGAEGGGSAEWGIRLPMYFDPLGTYNIIIGWGGSKVNPTHDPLLSGNGFPTYLTPSGYMFAGGLGARGSVVGTAQGGIGGGPNGYFYNGNQNGLNGVPFPDPSTYIASARGGGSLDSPYHFGGSSGAGQNSVASQPSAAGYGGDSINNIRGGFPRYPGGGVTIGGFIAISGMGGAASPYGPGGDGSEAISGFPHTPTAPGAGGGGSCSGAGGRPAIYVISGDGAPGYLRIEWRKVT